MTLAQERWLTLAAICAVLVLCIAVPFVGLPIFAWLIYRSIVLKRKEKSRQSDWRPMATPVDRREERIRVATTVATAHERLSAIAPGAAYYLANTLYLARGLIFDPTQSADQKKRMLSQGIEASAKARIEQADAGLGAIGLKFLIFMVSAQDGERSGNIVLNATYKTVANAGKAYRGLEARDMRPPTSFEMRALLQKQGVSCVADLVHKIQAEGRAMRVDVTDNIYGLLAMLDMREEAENPEFHRWISILEEALP